MSKKVKDLNKTLDLSVRLITVLKIGGTVMVMSIILMFIGLSSGFPQPATLIFFCTTFVCGAILSLVGMISEAILKHYKGKRTNIERLEELEILKLNNLEIEEIEIKRFGGK